MMFILPELNLLFVMRTLKASKKLISQ